MGTPSSEMIIQDVYLELKSLEIFYCTNGATFEGIAKRNGHRWTVVCEVKGVSWGGLRTESKGR